MYVYNEKYWKKEVHFTSWHNKVANILWILVIGLCKGGYIYMVEGRRLKQFHMH